MMLSRSRPQGKAGVVQEKPAKDELRWQDFVERRDYTGVRAPDPSLMPRAIVVAESSPLTGARAWGCGPGAGGAGV